ncbi:MAG: pyruvate, phosphate dikinase, partial [Proteobacteria bacterium]|nr:pyruvate, phosphate dikinase [Pseudomonadota bacterium]
MAPKYVYFFGGRKTEGKAAMKELLGGKGANLAEMTNLGMPVPAGFTITTKACQLYYENNRKWPQGLKEQVLANLKKLEGVMHAQLGNPLKTLLVSVRSGAASSMPGMMDTILNLGLNETVIEGLTKKTGNARFAWDAYRRFMQMFGDVVMGVPHDAFEHVLEEKKRSVNAQLDTDLSTADLKDIVAQYKAVYKKHTGEDFPVDPWQQLIKSINAVFESWNNKRAITYRRLNDIKGLLGTAVNIQAMVFGNMGESSGTGVCFSRNPSTGENKFYGEYLMNAQGEDVVAGIRTPQPITTLGKKNKQAYTRLLALKNRLEKHYRDMQDMEFTIQEGALYMLQTRSGKRTAAAAVQIAVDMVKEKRISREEALMRIEPEQLNQLLHPNFDPQAEKSAATLARGLPASPGAATGRVVFNAEDAESWAKRGEKVILTRIETSPEDIGGMNVAVGVLTSRGGMTSHAAVVARGMGTCCVAGVSALVIDYRQKTCTVGSTVIKEGDYISLNGSTGTVYAGRIKTVEPELSGSFSILMKWADEVRTLGVRTNADIPRDAVMAVKFGAEGIGLCRTEHMFFEGDRIISVRKMILADDKAGRESALKELLPIQRKDFEGLFTAMKGRPVTIRLIDPPLHEFLPADDTSQLEMSEVLSIPMQRVKEKVAELHEFNPMLGHRGCRLTITYPEILDMQVRAIIEAACECAAAGITVHPEIMIPLTIDKKELQILETRTRQVADGIIKEKAAKLKYLVGTMIEVPRAALLADQIAEVAEFFSFGTNDLTQMTMGISRDDAGKFLPEYVDEKKAGIFSDDPFQSLDQVGVGMLVKMAIEKGRKSKPDLKIGICGEHGGDPKSVEFCCRVGMNYVSCSPFRVPIARLAAAQAEIKRIAQLGQPAAAG